MLRNDRFTCSACVCSFPIDQRGYNGMCVDCTAERNEAFAYMDNDDGRYMSGYRVFANGSYREDFGADR